MAERELNARENLLLAARMTHNNEIIDVAEVLNETNDVIADAVVQRANDITSHVVARRTALPAPSWVKVGEGWNASVGRLQQAREQIGQLKARFQCPGCDAITAESGKVSPTAGAGIHRGHGPRIF